MSQHTDTDDDHDGLSADDDCPQCDDGTLYHEPWIKCGTEQQFNNGKTGGVACNNCTFSRITNDHSPLDDDPVQCREDGCTNENQPVLLYDGRCEDCAQQRHYEQMREEMEEQQEDTANV